MIPDPANFSLTLSEIRRALRRYRLQSLAFFVAVSAVAVGGSFLMPKSFLSEAKLFVRFGRENLSLDPSATTGQMISVNESRESEINSLLEVMRSRSLVDRAVARIGAANIMAGVNPAASAALTANHTGDETFVTASALPAVDEPQFDKVHQQAVRFLEKNVFVQAPRKSNIISVTAKAASPELAQRIVGELVDLYLQEHTRVNSTAGSYQFFADETATLRTKWEAALEQLRQAKDRYQIITVAGKRTALENRIAQINTLQDANAAALSQSRGRSESLTTLLKSVPETLVMSDTAGFPNVPADSLRSGYHALQLQATDLLARYNDDHPQVKVIKQQLEEGRKALENEGETRSQATTSRHPTRLALELALLNEEANAVALQEGAKALQSEAGETLAELRDLNQHEVELAGLAQREQLAGANFQRSSEKLEQARVSRELDHDGISNLRLVQAASFNSTPKGLGKKVVWLLGGFVAVTGAIGLALILAWLNPQLRSVDELQKLLGVPVLATVRRNDFSNAAPSTTETPMLV